MIPATEARTASEAPLRVCLLHDYREQQQMSMKLYAEKLGDALEEQGVDVERVRVPDLLPDLWRGFPGLGKIDSYVGRFVALPLAARRSRADVYHIVDHGQAYLLGHVDPRRTVVTCHDVILLALAAGRLKSENPSRVATQVLRYAVNHLPKARRVIADSKHTVRDLVSLVGVDPDKVEVVYPGLNGRFRRAPELRQQARRRWNLGDAPLILHVGQAGFYKNVDGCLRVLAKLREGGIDAKFVRVGQPLRPPQLALAERLAVAGALFQLGHLDEEELVAAYNAADVLLFPSLYEGFGWPPLEAMACGTPVVCTREGSLGEIVGDAAAVASPHDIDALARHVAEILTNQERALELRARGGARAALFDWRHAAARVCKVYREVAAA